MYEHYPAKIGKNWQVGDDNRRLGIFVSQNGIREMTMKSMQNKRQECIKMKEKMD